MSERNVLVVEDDPAMARMLAEGLSEIGWQAGTARGVAEALTLFSLRTYSAVVSDVHLPGEDGFALLAAVRASAHPAPVILMSSFAGADTACRAHEMGAVAFLSKPFAFRVLVSLLAGLHDEIARS